MSDVVDSKASKEEGSEQSHKSKMKIKRKQSVALKNETMGKFITRSAILIALLLPVAGLFGILFTAKGWGATVVRTLEPYYDISRLVAAGGLGMIILLYLLDFSYWKGFWRTIRSFLLLLSVVTIAAGSVLMAREYAALPMLIYLMLVPIYVVMCKRTCWKNTDNYYFLSSLAPALLFLGILGIVTWVVLTMSPKEPEVWPGGNNVVKAKYYDKLLCRDTSYRCKGLTCKNLDIELNLESDECEKFKLEGGCVVSNNDGIYKTQGTKGYTATSWKHVGIQEALLKEQISKLEKEASKSNTSATTNNNNVNALDTLMNYNETEIVKHHRWQQLIGKYGYPSLRDADVDCATAGYLLYIGLLVASVMLVIFSVVTHFISRGMKRKSPRTQLRVFAMLGALSILGMWMATTIAGSTPQISNLVMLFSFVGMAVVAFMAVSAIGWGSIKTDLMSVPLIKSMAGAGESDWLKAMAMFFVIPYLFFLGLSAVNQFFRLYLTPCAKKVGRKERKRCLTNVAHKQMNMIKKWPFTDIFKKVRTGLVFFYMYHFLFSSHFSFQFF
jgi:hypothetical protein